MKSMMKTALLACTAITAVHCTHKEVREPASAKNIITNVETQALGDLLGGDSPLNNYRHKMKVQFHTNGDKNYLSSTARKALNEALIETLGTENPEQGLAKLAAGNLKDALVENFIKTLRIYKIVNMGLQVDLVFTPEPNFKNNYAAELNSNQLVRLSETGQLGKKWDLLEKSTTTETLYNNSSLIPLKSGSADYIGGAMSLYVEILDVGPGFLKIKKDAVKGFVRYRRYYRLNKDLQQTAACDNFVATAKTAGPGVPLFYTVDLYKNFNLKNIIPTEETLEIFPGVLASHNEGRKELMPDTYEKSGKSINTGNFVVEQKSNAFGQVTFKLKKIVYDLKDRELDKGRTEAELVSFHSPGNTNTLVEDQQALSNASRTYLKKCETSMETFLNLRALGGLL